MTLTGRRGSGEFTLPQDEPARVLVVDDEPELRRSLARLLLSRGMHVLTASDGASAVEILMQEDVDVALFDLMMPNMTGLELLERAKADQIGVEVIIMTAFGDVETAVNAVRAGAYHFLTKPFRSNDEVVLTVTKAAERRRLLRRTMALEQRLEQMEKFGELIGNSPPMQEVYRLAMGVAATSSTVLILGESGTGKELTARAIHQHSPRAKGAFVAVNCSAIPVDLVESELFGHIKGAFSGATMTRAGLFETAHGGTIFLDEVGDLPPLAQVKLLRVLQEGEIKPIGSNTMRNVDVRVIAATNVDLQEQISSGRFREDLYYRLNVIAIMLPALRDRREDIPLLAHHFLKKYTARFGSDAKRITPEAMRVLQSQHWPGNVRELENAIEHAVVFCRDQAINPQELPVGKPSSVPNLRDAAPAPSNGELLDLPYKEAKKRALAAFEQTYFAALLDRSGGNISEAARQAGLDRSNFRRARQRTQQSAPHAQRGVSGHAKR